MQIDATVVNAEGFIRLLEEMMDLKIQRYAETHLKLSTEVMGLLAQKRETDTRRLQQIRADLLRLLVEDQPA